jgi:hypothetical protein
MRSIMNVLQRIGVVIILLSHFALCGFAQHGIITTYAGPSLPVNGAKAITQAIDDPVSVVSDNAGGFYVSSRKQNRIYRVTAGIGSSCYSGDGGLATTAQQHCPGGLCVDLAGNLYIADSENNRIRKVTPAGIITTAGTEAWRRKQSFRRQMTWPSILRATSISQIQ